MAARVLGVVLCGVALALACATGARPPQGATAPEDTAASVERRADDADSTEAADPAQSLSAADEQPRPSAGAPAAAQPSETAAGPGTPRGQYLDLPVPEHSTALVWLPAGTTRLPLVVIAHGAGGNAYWHCEYWRQVLQEVAILLCLNGKPMRAQSEEYYFPEHHTLGRITAAALTAFDAQYGGRVAADSGVYIGYSQGASMGALMLPLHAKRLSRALLLEGGYSEWSVARARTFKRSGGQSVFIACGTRGCERGARRSVDWLDSAGLRAGFSYAEGAGHTPAGAVGRSAVEGLKWLWQLPPEQSKPADNAP